MSSVNRSKNHNGAAEVGYINYAIRARCSCGWLSDGKTDKASALRSLTHHRARALKGN